MAYTSLAEWIQVLETMHAELETIVCRFIGAIHLSRQIFSFFTRLGSSGAMPTHWLRTNCQTTSWFGLTVNAGITIPVHQGGKFGALQTCIAPPASVKHSHAW